MAFYRIKLTKKNPSRKRLWVDIDNKYIQYGYGYVAYKNILNVIGFLVGKMLMPITIVQNVSKEVEGKSDWSRTIYKEDIIIDSLYKKAILMGSILFLVTSLQVINFNILLTRQYS